MARQFQFRRGVESNWTSVNPVLAEGELGVALDVSNFKIGDGSNSWNALAYATGAGPVDWAVSTLGSGTGITISTGAVTNTLFHPAFLTTAGGGEWTVDTTTGIDFIISTASDINTLYYPEVNGIGIAESGGGTYNAGILIISNDSSNNVSLGISYNGSLDEMYLTASAAFTQSTHDHPYILTANASLYQTAGDYLTTSAGWDSNYITSESTHAHPYMPSGESHIRELNASNGSYWGGTVNLVESGNITVSATGESIVFSVPAQSTHSHVVYQTPGDYLTTSAGWDSIYITSESTHSHLAAGTLSFINSNGISFGSSSDGSTTSVSASVETAYVLLANSTKFAGVNLSISSGHAGSTLAASLGTAGLTLSVPAWITTGGGSQSKQPVAVEGTNGSYEFSTLKFITGNGMSFYTDASGIRGSYTVPASGTLSFINSNGISFGSSLDGSTTSVSASVETAYVPLANSTKFLMSWELEGNNTAGTTGSSQGGTIYLSGGNNITLSGNSNTLIISGAAAAAGDSFFKGWSLAGANTLGTNITALGATASLYLSGGPGITLSGNSNTVVISKQNQIISRVEPVPYIGVTRSVDATSRTWWVYPFNVPQDLSFDICRIIVSHAAVGAATTQGTTANRTIGATVSDTRYAVIYSQGAAGGDNSRSLQYVTSGGISILQNWGASLNSNGSEQTQSTYAHYPSDFGSNYITKQETKETTVTNISINASWSSVYSGYKYLDIPFGAASLSAGNYWIAFGGSKSSATGDSGGTRFLSVSANGGTQVGISGANIAIGQWGQATNASNNSWTHAAAIWTTNAQGTTASIAFNQMSSSASHNVPYFVLMATR